MRSQTVEWDGELIDLLVPESTEEFLSEGFVASEEDLVRLAVWGWLSIARHAHLRGEDVHSYTYEGRRPATESP